MHNSTFQIGREGEKASFVNIVATSPSIEVLNRAKFVASFTSGDYGYFLFQEIEFSTGDRVNKVSTVTAQFHGSVLRPDLTQNSAKRVLKSNTPRKQFCLQCTFPRLVFARARGRIIMKFPTRAPRLKLLSRSFGSKQKYFSVRRNIFEFHFRSQKCEHIWLQN